MHYLNGKFSYDDFFCKTHARPYIDLFIYADFGETVWMRLEIRAELLEEDRNS